MENTLLIKVLKTFSSYEFKEFGKFVESPIFNQRMRLIRLYGVLKNYYPDFKSNDFNRENIFKKLYPVEKYNDKKLRDGFSALLNLAENYLSFTEYVKNQYIVKKNLLTALDKKRIDKLFEKYYPILENQIKENVYRKEDFFQYESELRELWLLHFKSKDNESMVAKGILEFSECQLFYFLAVIMKRFQNIETYNNSFNTDFNGSFVYEFMNCLDIEKLLNFLKSQNQKFYPFFALNYFYLLTLKDPNDESSFVNFKEIFYEKIDSFKGEEKFHFYRCMESCLTLKNWYEHGKYNRLLFNLYKKMLDEKIYSFDSEEQTSLYFFRNIILVACKVNELKWAEKFIDDNINAILPNHRSNMLYLSKGLIEFKRMNYEKVLHELSKIKQEFFHFKVDIKLLIMKCYYELDYQEELITLMDSAKHFFAKNKLLLDNYRDGYYNFTNALNGILKIKKGFGSSDLDTLRKQVLDSKYLSNKEWLIQKIDELR